MPRNINQVSEASNPEEVVQYALQTQDASAALQSSIVDAQLSHRPISIGNPLPTGLLPLADPSVFPNQLGPGTQENIAGSNPRTTFTATPDHRRGPNSPGADSPYPLPAAEISTPIRPGRDAFIANQMNHAGSSGQANGSGLGGTPEKGKAPASIPIQSDINAKHSLWKHVQGQPPVLYIRPQDDRNMIPHFFGVDGVNENNSVYAAQAPDELLEPINDNKKYEIHPAYQMWATSTIPQDEVILHERCLLVLEESNIFGRKDVCVADVQYTIQTAPPEAKKYLQSLHPSTGGLRVTTQSNHFTRDPNGHMIRRYYHKISNVRHCCSPNAQLTLLDHDHDQSVTLRAIRKIKKGEEITVAYLEMDNENTEPRMREIYNIRCAKDCKLCTTPDTTIAQYQGHANATHRAGQPAPQPDTPIQTQRFSKPTSMLQHGLKSNRTSTAETMQGSFQDRDNDSQKNVAMPASFHNNNNLPINHDALPSPPPSVLPNDDREFSCGLFDSIKGWFSTAGGKALRIRGKVSEFSKKMSIKRHAVPRDSGAGGNTIPDGAVLTDILPALRASPPDNMTPAR